ncbi:MAG: asparagine synthase (glutamine-hydrolyzing) [Myxococcales bacterium]|nr:asparagine synthase (glutamine-hydrolyzing) [Myxococcales bacterium]
MCGICGVIGLAGEEGTQLVDRMTASIHHRGPDETGQFAEGGVALGHKRLSIIDLGGGQQPMRTPDGRYVLVYNGEIYNYRELRDELAAEGVAFRTESDTEVLLELLRTRGPAALERLNGMFAFAFWDREARELLLARDRIGIKPLYYVEAPNCFLFASETKALLHHPGWKRALNPHAIQDYLALRYVPGDRGLLQEVRRLAPGHWMKVRGQELEIERYWSPPIHTGGYPKSEDEYLDELAERLEASVRRRLISDVPVGAYLSGGLDSSVLVALMSKQLSQPVKTFSVGFGYEHDELSEAAATARLLGTDHTEVTCSASDVMLLPDIVYHSDEPLGDAIAIPMYKLAREAKKQVTVILTGEGADEIFGGYLFHKILWAADWYARLVPSGVRRRVVEPLASLVPASVLNLAFRYPAYLGDRGKLKALDYLEMAGSGDLDRGYRHLISLFDQRDTESIYTPEFEEQLRGASRLWEPPVDCEGPRFDQLLRLQFGHWLQDNMLLRNDKMSMAHAIEGRVPFLDHELVEFAFRLPRKLRLRRMTGKYILRRFAERVLPRATAQRRKMPFYVPIENYFQHAEFVELMEDVLGEESVRQRGIFRPEAVARLRQSMHARDFLLVKQAFSLITLELWFRSFVDGHG